MKTIKPISENLEYYEYNDELKLVHLIKEDMFQCKSILDSLKTSKNKQTHHWLENKDTKELFEGFESITEFRDGVLIKQFTFNNNLKHYNGYYIHRLLVNHFAMWANKKYAYKIALILDNYFENLRLKKEMSEKEDCIIRLENLVKIQSNKIDQQSELINTLNNKIDNQTKRVKLRASSTASQTAEK